MQSVGGVSRKIYRCETLWQKRLQELTHSLPIDEMYIKTPSNTSTQSTINNFTTIREINYANTLCPDVLHADQHIIKFKVVFKDLIRPSGCHHIWCPVWSLIGKLSKMNIAGNLPSLDKVFASHHQSHSRLWMVVGYMMEQSTGKYHIFSPHEYQSTHTTSH